MLSQLERHFESLWEEYYPEIDLVAEAKIIPGRRYRFDYAHLQSRIAIELNGQIWKKGGHNSGAGLLRDYEKINLAAANGWRVFQLAPEMVTAENLELIAKTIGKFAIFCN